MSNENRNESKQGSANSLPILDVVTVVTTGIRAAQWTGSEASLRAIQQLLWPDSPLRERMSKTVGVYVPSKDANTRSFIPSQLQFANEGDWIVSDGERVEIVERKLFERRYATTTAAVNAKPADIAPTAF